MRRLLISAFLFFVLSSSAFGAIAVDQSGANQTGSVTSVTATFGQTSGSGTATSTASGAIVFTCSKRGADASSTLSITDSASQTGWIQTTAGYVTSGTDRIGCFFRPNSASLSTVTCSWSGGTTATVACVAVSFTGIATSSPSDKSLSSTCTPSCSSISSGSFTTTKAHEVLIYGVGDGASQAAGCSNGWIVNGSYTFPANGCAPRLAIEYNIVSVTNSYSTTMGANTITGTMLGDFESFADTPVSGTPKKPPVIL